MEDGIYYAIEVNGKGEHNSFLYDTRNKADKAYKFLYEKFFDHKVLDTSKVSSLDEIVELGICETIVGTVPKNLMASFVPSALFTEVYEQMLLDAREYYDKNKY